MMAREISDLIWKYLEVKHGCSRYTNSFEIRRVLFNNAYEVTVFIGGSRQIFKKLTITDEQLEDFSEIDFKAKVTVSGKEDNMITNRAAAEALARQAAEALAKVEAIEAKYGKDEDYKNGDVLLVEIMYNNAEHTYKYAIVKANYSWYSTAIAASAFKRGSFEDLIYWMENVNGTVVSMRKLGKGKAIIRNGVRV